MVKSLRDRNKEDEAFPTFLDASSDHMITDMPTWWYYRPHNMGGIHCV